MTIKVGDTLPNATLLVFDENGPATVELADKLKGRNVVIFGLPGAYTRTCSAAHVPSFIAAHDDLKAKGVDEVICIAVNDPFVMAAWSRDTGAGAAGIAMLGDPESTFTKAIGMEFSFAPLGFVNRSKRYSLYAEDGVVKVFNPEPEGGGCEISAGQTMVAQIG